MRARLTKALGETGADALHARLQAQDPVAAAKIHPRNPQRLLRALEVIELTGKPISAQWTQSSAAERLQADVIQCGLVPDDRSRLHDLIEQRFDTMLAEGFVEEVKALYARGDLHPEMPALRAVGYRQAWQHLAGELSFAEFRANAITATRRLAKRQLTWMRSWPDLSQFDWDDPDVVAGRLAQRLTAR